MSEDAQDLRRRMEQAVADMDFELAAQLRDALALLGEPSKGSYLRPQRLGEMGIGTSDQKMKPPAGWTPPKRPDPMTSGHKKRKGPR